MRKKLDTRFPASRIKKIMQADEDVGKIALAVPVLVSKALELFLQDLCDRTYDITLQRGVKTMSSLHLGPGFCMQKELHLCGDRAGSELYTSQKFWVINVEDGDTQEIAKLNHTVRKDQMTASWFTPLI